MQHYRQSFRLLATVLLCLCLVGVAVHCTSKEDNPAVVAEQTFVPEAPDYGNRFFAPYYRHTTIDAWVTQNEDTIRQRTRLAMADVCAAFDHFQQRDPSRPLVIAASDICINPVNWRTDATPATLHDTITIAVSTEHHVLVATGYSASEYPPYKDLINVGDIHSCEPWLYSECLARNIAVRTAEWRRQN